MGDEASLWMRVKVAGFGWSSALMLKGGAQGAPDGSESEGWATGGGWNSSLKQPSRRQRLTFQGERARRGGEGRAALILEVEVAVDDHGTCNVVVYAEYWVVNR